MTKISKNSDIIKHLNAIRAKGWDAIIGGSAIADIYHGKTIPSIRKVDILIEAKSKPRTLPLINSYHSKDWIHYWYNIFNMKDYDEIKFIGDYNVFKKLNDHINAVWELICYGKKYIVIIVDKDPRKYVEQHFDFGITMAYCDGLKMHFTNEFLTDSMNETLTLYTTGLTTAQVLYAKTKRVKKLAEKYPGWTIKL